MLAQEKRGRARATAEPLKVYENITELGGRSITLNKGRYGPYITDGEVNASLPRTMEDPLTLTVPQALELLAAARERQGSKGGARKKKAVRKSAASAEGPASESEPKAKAAKKASSKKGTGKKAASKKAASKKSAKKKAPSAGAESEAEPDGDGS